MTDSVYLAPAHGGQRCSDREAELTNKLAFQEKVSEGLLATIRRLEGELAKRGSGMEQLTTAVAELRNLK